PEQKSEAAEAFGAEQDFLSATKKLLDTKHSAYKAVTAIRGKVRAYWKSVSLPYPEAGLRLIEHSRVEVFDEQMRELQSELANAVQDLDQHYSELKASARRRLGSLYNPADYPDSLQGLFEIHWDFPSVEPPDYLMQLSPAIYEQQSALAAAR